MGKTKIEWCDYTINPVIGCKNGCPYCYARKLNDRFKFVEDFNEPQFFEERLKQINKLYNKVIFMDSMSDIAYWPSEAFKKTMIAINNNHTNYYLFLSKSPHLIGGVDWYENSNLWLGVSITKNNDKNRINLLDSENIVKNQFVSIEPLIEPIEFYGNELSNRKNKVIPKKEWIVDIVDQCRKHSIPVFMKNSLKEIMGNDFIQEFPKEFNR